MRVAMIFIVYILLCPAMAFGWIGIMWRGSASLYTAMEKLVISELKQLTFRADRGIVGQHLKKRGI